MKNAIIAVGLAAASLVAIGAAQTADSAPPALMQEKVPPLMQALRVPGIAIAKVEGGEIAWQSAFGERAPGEPLTGESIFNVASLTKPVFATMALHEVAAGNLALDESLSAHWVDPDIADDPRHEKLTPRIVLSHQSGLPNWRGGRELGFMFEPGTRHEYSGEGFEYLRRALENKTGKRMNELVTETVFEPANMENTAAGWREEFVARAVQGYNEAGEPIDTGLASRTANAAANLMTTIGDYANFTAWVSNGADLPTPLFKEMQSPQALHDDPAERFGLGWKLIPLDGQEALMHDGREPGVRTYAIILPKTREALVIFTNSSNGELTFRPIIRMALDAGDEILASTDALVWDYLLHLPPQALVPMSKGIARSPSYLSTLLHAVDTVLVQSSALSVAEKRRAAARVDDYVHARLNGKVSVEQAEALVARLLEKNGEMLKLRTSFDEDAAREWLQALET